MKRILIVEDDRRLASMLADVLLDEGVEAVHASDLEEAESLFSRNRIDAAILDIRLGHSQSFAFARKLGTHGVPYLFASSARRIDMPHDLRWQPLIAKPYSAEQLIIALRALCGEIYRDSGVHPPAERDGKHPEI